MMIRTIKNSLLVLCIAGTMGVGCKTMNKQQKGVLIGAGAGGAVGAGVGKAAGNTALGAIIGATVGGVTGGVIGRKMDKQAEEMAKIPGAEVKRVEEGINVTFESGVLFGVNQSSLNATAQGNIRQLAEVLNKYPDTYVLIEGHTDNTGSASHNMTLSERRAKSVADYLRSQNIASSRLKTAWYGLTQPKYPNDSEANRAKNRRVEFAIYANEKMVEEAKRESNG
ncbi:OmpA family protein [Aridibaculum aurantiacum]|uniref:OmpA family protein n=1 Tax=Aridibaculum aurantiacum TaxID=2810307 RepID=UPI001A973C8F|nr:OmpA family protein [Aridibaculum aurantiacum]